MNIPMNSFSLQATSAAFENPTNHANDDIGKVEELMKVISKLEYNIKNKYLFIIFTHFFRKFYNKKNLDFSNSIFTKMPPADGVIRHQTSFTNNLF